MPKASKRNRKRKHEDDKSSKAPDGMFELAYGIAHNGGTALKCKWAPEGSAKKGGISRGPLGLLATVFEDGSLRWVEACGREETGESRT